jgi:hypothetical protein
VAEAGLLPEDREFDVGLGKLIMLALLAAVLLGSAPEVACVALAQSGACTSACRSQYNQCRIATKGSPSCDAQFAACMQRCISSRRR